MWLIVKQFLIKAGWQDAPLALWDLSITNCTIFMASTTVTRSLVTTRIYHCLLHSQIPYPANELLKFSCVLACSYEPRKAHLKLDIVEKNLPPGFRQRILNLITLPHFPNPTSINIRTRNIEYLTQPTASFLWVKPWTKWCDSS